MSDVDSVLRAQQQHINTYGWAVTAVLPAHDEDCLFAYTVGLTDHRHRELIIAGLHPLIAHALLGDLAIQVIHHRARFTHGQRLYDLIAGYDAVVVEGPATQVLHPGTAYARYGPTRVAIAQIVWPDRDSRFPWDEGYSLPPHAQPLLARP